MENEIKEKKNSFYTDAQVYWSSIPATLDGMLGGFGFLTETDIQGSKKFLNKLFQMKKPPGKEKALDCGAGIGRITKNLLIPHFDKVDLIEQCPKFIDEAKVLLTETNQIENFFCFGLQDFESSPNAYDVIWCQWVLGHLTDSDFITFFKNCASSLRPNGVIVVKENLTSQKSAIKDNIDSSVTRPLEHLRRLFKEAGLRCIHEEKQRKFPKELFDVFMFALKPQQPSQELKINSDISS